MRSPIVHVPNYQPVTSVYSVTGEDNKTSAIVTQNIRLIRHEDPLLAGHSNKSTDTVQVDSDKVTAITRTMTFATGGLDTLLVDSDIQVKMDTFGRIFGINSVRSSDLSTLYSINTDYTIIPTDRNNTFSIQRPPSSRIPLDANILVSYNKYLLHEYCVRVDAEIVGFVGTAPSLLAHPGFVHNVWMPEYYGDTTLSMDGWAANPINYPLGTLCEAKIPKQNRYIKVTYDNGTGVKVMVEERDYHLTVDSKTGNANLIRIMTGRIPDSGVVKVSYFYNERFSITTGYPGFVEQVSYMVEQTRHAAADVVVKQMTENPVDVILTVELTDSTTPEIMDGRIRTAIGNVLSNVRTKITQAEIIRQVKSLNGVANVNVPLTKFAKSDGALNIGHVITTGTQWIPIMNDPEFASRHFPQNTWISKAPVLEDNTIPSGGLPDEYVGFLYEGESYRRGMSIEDFIANPPTDWSGSFYIIGEDDQVDSLHPLDPAYSGRIILITPKYFTDPSVMNFKVTYQVFREGGAKDITLSPTEFLRAGRITIDYL